MLRNSFEITFVIVKFVSRPTPGFPKALLRSLYQPFQQSHRLLIVDYKPGEAGLHL